MKNSIRNVAILLSSFIILSSCSSGGPTTPNRPALPNLQKAPSSSPEVEIKRLNLNGRIIDAVTRKPIENANVIVYAITNDKIFKTLSNQSVPATIPSTSPQNNNAPAPISASVEPPINNPSPIEEEEEKVVKSPTPSKPPIKGKIETKQQKPKPLENLKPSSKPSTKTAEATDENIENKNELKFDIVSALSDIKPNDIEPFETKTGNDGKFWLNKVPENNLIITVSANNYQSVSIFSPETAKMEDILLKPIQNSETGYLKGFVLTANNNSASNAFVSSSYIAGEEFNIPETSSEEGEFLLKSLSIGERTILATTKDETGKIVAMGMKDIQIKKAQLPKEDKNPKQTPSPTPSSSPLPEKKKEGEEIKIKAVTNYINVKGKIDVPDGLTLKNVNVYIEFKKKGQPKEELFVLSEELPSKAESFELSLPELEAGYYYHLEFSAYDKRGAFVYHHEYKVKPEINEKQVQTKEKKDLINVKFIKPVTQGISDYLEKESIKLPIFNWEPAEGSDFYKVTLYRSDKMGITQSIWEAYTPFNSAVYVPNDKNEKEKFSKEYKYTWTVEALREKPETRSTAEKLPISKLNLSSWSDSSRSSEFDFEIPKEKVDEIEEIDTSKKKEG